jgi:RNA polymerase sigma-70 factor (ECF subfamily)
LNQRRQERRRRHRENRAARPAVFNPSGERFAGFTSDELAAALDRLDGQTHEIIVTHIWGGLRFEQIARNLNTSTSTAHRRYCAGLRTLRDALVKPCENPK